MGVQQHQAAWRPLPVEANRQRKTPRGANDLRRNVGRVRYQIGFAGSCFFRANHCHFIARYDEGTAFMPVVESKRNLPQSDKFQFMALDEDGYDCPADWLVAFPCISQNRAHLTDTHYIRIRVIG